MTFLRKYLLICVGYASAVMGMGFWIAAGVMLKSETAAAMAVAYIAEGALVLVGGVGPLLFLVGSGQPPLF